jgi:hypothetical protein
MSRFLLSTLAVGALFAASLPGAASTLLGTNGTMLANGLDSTNGTMLANGLTSNGVTLTNGAETGGLSLTGVILPGAAE